MPDVFDSLFAVLEQRKGNDPKTSYVAKLYDKGLAKINEKVIEEAGELVEATEIKGKDQVVYEACDLLFHTFVLCAHQGISLSDLEKELDRRFGTSGIVEKNNRKKA